MAVLIEAISVVVKADSLLKSFNGNWEAFKEIVPNQTLCADNEIVRVGFMTPTDVESFINKLEKQGLVFIRNGDSVDICVVDQLKGPTVKCSWIEYGHISMSNAGHRVAACRLVGSKLMQVVTPPGWVYEKSLSSSYGYVPTGHKDGGLKYLRHEDGLDVYLNTLTGAEVYVGRTGES
ncbi:MAG TPA: hypothetical protein PK953_02995 [Smithellaceae bacterium]|jgi:hypothetical protein|nr:hypothetical protein [Smithellaceae bacterium]